MEVTESASAAVFEKLNPWFRHGAEEVCSVRKQCQGRLERPVHPFHKHTSHLGGVVLSLLSAELNPDPPDLLWGAMSGENLVKANEGATQTVCFNFCGFIQPAICSPCYASCNCLPLG